MSYQGSWVIRIHSLWTWCSKKYSLFQTTKVPKGHKSLLCNRPTYATQRSESLNRVNKPILEPEMTDLPGRGRSHAAVSLGLLHFPTCTVPNFCAHTHTHTHTLALLCFTPYTRTRICLYKGCMHGTRQKSPQNMGIHEIGHYQTAWKQYCPLDLLFLTALQEIVFWSGINSSF